MNTPSQNPIKPVPTQDSADGDTDVRKNETQPATRIAAEPQLPPTEPKQPNPKNRLRKIANLRKAGIFWMEIGTFIALIAYATITKNQWETATHATNAAEIAANAAQSQIGKMDESNRINREALESVQRAFVIFPAMPKFSPPVQTLGKGTYYTLEIPIQNVGATQAQSLRDRVSCAVPMHPLPDDYTFPDKSGQCGTPHVAWGANFIAAKDQIFSQAVSLDRQIIMEFYHTGIARLSNRHIPSRSIYFYGWVTYRDIFKDTPTHLTEFCRRLTGFIPTPQTGGAEIEWEYCDHHNCTDEDCPDYKKKVRQAP